MISIKQMWSNSERKFDTFIHLLQVSVISTWAELPSQLQQAIPAKAMIAIVAVIGLTGVTHKMIINKVAGNKNG